MPKEVPNKRDICRMQEAGDKDDAAKSGAAISKPAADLMETAKPQSQRRESIRRKGRSALRSLKCAPISRPDSPAAFRRKPSLPGIFYIVWIEQHLLL